MILTYYREEPNFGDAINPIIFDHFMPGFFDDDPKSVFLGIGSILGLYSGTEATDRIIVFSSGYAYGDMPAADKRYDIRCVRGPNTARVLNLDPGLAVTDGAVLLRHIPGYEQVGEKKYPFSIVPHHMSEKMFHKWNDVFQEAGLNHISPKMNAPEAIRQIRQSECILAEAMHAAIIADCYRIPWIPVKMFGHINSFKWEDWTLSMGMNYSPHSTPSLFNDMHIRQVLHEKMPWDKGIMAAAIAPAYKTYQHYHKERKFISAIKQIMQKQPLLSKESLLQSKTSQLLDILESIRIDYTSRGPENATAP